MTNIEAIRESAASRAEFIRENEGKVFLLKNERGENITLIVEDGEMTETVYGKPNFGWVKRVDGNGEYYAVGGVFEKKPKEPDDYFERMLCRIRERGCELSKCTDCDGCPMRDYCFPGFNPIEEMAREIKRQRKEIEKLKKGINAMEGEKV